MSAGLAIAVNGTPSSGIREADSGAGVGSRTPAAAADSGAGAGSRTPAARVRVHPLSPRREDE